MGTVLVEKDIRVFCSLPITFGKHREAAINVYRKTDRGFSEGELDRIEKVAETIQYLFNSVRDEIGLHLLRDVEHMLRCRGTAAFNDVVAKIAEVFNVQECALYLENQRETPNRFQLKASRAPDGWRLTPEYDRNDPGYTMYAVQTGEPLEIVDLRYYDDDHLAKSGVDINQARRAEGLLDSRKFFGTEQLPPLNLICNPIKHQARVIGAIRCCAPKGPYFFDNTHIELLGFVADQIGERWGTSLNLERKAPRRGGSKHSSRASTRSTTSRSGRSRISRDLRTNGKWTGLWSY